MVICSSRVWDMQGLGPPPYPAYATDGSKVKNSLWQGKRKKFDIIFISNSILYIFRENLKLLLKIVEIEFNYSFTEPTGAGGVPT